MSTETFLDPNAGLISCDVFVREKVLGPEDVVYDSWHVVISLPAYVQWTPCVWVGLDEGERRLWPVPADWRMTAIFQKTRLVFAVDAAEERSPPRSRSVRKGG